MNRLIDAALQRSRTVLMSFALVFFVGLGAMISISKESYPDIRLPMVYVSIHHDGISPEDADRLLYQPMEKELKSLDGLKEIIATASESHQSILLEFQSDVDIDKALNDVRERVDRGKAELPEATDEPVVEEINLALFPILVVTLAGDLDEALLFNIADDLSERLEALPGVLEASVNGDREEIGEIIIEPTRMSSYNLSQADLYELVSRNNQLVAAGTMDTGFGRFSVKVPGLIEDETDILSLPIKVDGDQVVTFGDIAVGRRAYKDPESIARVNGKRAVTVEVSKRIGGNIIEIVDQVKGKVEEVSGYWPEGLEYGYSLDQSQETRRSLDDLFNNVMAATILVMVVIVASLGLRSALLVGLAIPGSFLIGIMVLYFMAYTLNMVVLFALILSVGMLVDGAIVVTEYADRRMVEGASRLEAYGEAAKRMAWPIIASTSTTLAVFMPLLFWPDITGEFMKYLPITVLMTLSASLILALIIVPTIGSLVGKAGAQDKQLLNTMLAAEQGNFEQIRGLAGYYVKLLKRLLERPWLVLLGALGCLFGTFIIYSQLGQGVEFFPEVDAEVALVNVHARGNLALDERDALVQEVENRILGMPELKTIYSKTLIKAPHEESADVVGQIQLEFIDWEQRRSTKAILREIEQRTQDIAGIIIETKEKEDGPATGADVQLEISATDEQLLNQTTLQIYQRFQQNSALKDVQNNLPLPGIQWEIEVDKAQASKFGADLTTVGSAIQMLTTGLQVGDYRPECADDEVEIRVRFPYNARNLDELDNLIVPINGELVPISNFVNRVAKPKVSEIRRINGRRAYDITANVIEGQRPDLVIRAIAEQLTAAELPPSVQFRFRGDQEEQQTAALFLMKAFAIAFFIMLTILVTQFNSFFQAGLILSAVILSTAGVFIGLMLRGEPFGIVMSGVGVIALAGIVVNNNIVFIDTFNRLYAEGIAAKEAALRTGAQRLRPVLLTTFTTILGLAPMVFQWNIDLLGRHLSIGSPSSQWWTQLSTAIAGGLAFATLLTLILTPCLLVLKSRKSDRAQGFELSANRTPS